VLHILAPVLRLTFLTTLLLLALGTATAGAAAPAAVPKGWLGVMADGPLSDGSIDIGSEFGAMSRAHVGSVRFAIYWDVAQPEQSGATDFSAADRFVAAAARRGIPLLPVVVRAPAWARLHPELQNSPPSASGIEAYTRFLTELIGRYGPAGSFWGEHPELARQPIRQWQIWNEPDGVRDWSDQPGIPAYMPLLRAAHAAVKAADPGAKVVLAGLVGRSWEHLAEVYRRGGRPYFDIAAIHPFTETVKHVMLLVRNARATMRRHGDARKPLVLSELSWPSAKGKTKYTYGFEVTPRQQAARLRSSVLAIARQRRALRIAAVYWSSWISYDRSRLYSFDYAGLLRAKGGKVIRKPAFYAFRSVAAQLHSR
jgi:hypothetical protein